MLERSRKRTMATCRKPNKTLDCDTFAANSFRHIPYTPNIRRQAVRISKEEWQKHEARMRELHAEGCTSERARQILRDETEGVNGCFNPSVAQYNAQLK